MRRAFVVLALLALMIGVKTLQETGGDAGRDPLTLATIGFVLLAAFTIAEIGAHLGLPRVTGYILGGALLGPSVSSLLAGPVVAEMRMFNTLALGLIAVSAGLELDVRQISKVWRTLVATIGFKLLFLLLLVGGGLIAYERVLPTLGLDSSAKLHGLAVVFAALAIGTSPAITLAILNEAKAKGRAADIFLGAAVLKDLVVVVALALAVAIARPWIGVSAGEHGQNALVAVGIELGSSIVAGCVLGLLLIGYLRFVKAEMLLFVAAMILVVSELGRALHLELLLVFITAGFIVKNFSRYEHELMTPVEMVALPVFVVFFTNAGASIDLRHMVQLLPIALCLCLLRGLGMYAASALGARAGKEAPKVVAHAWLGYIPQAGVTLGLVGLAAEQLPPLRDSILGLGMAVVAVNLLVGPLTLRMALTRTLDSKVGSAGTTVSGAPVARPSLAPWSELPPGAPRPDFRAQLDRFTSRPGLAGVGKELSRIDLQLRDIARRHEADLSQRVTKRMSDPLRASLPTSGAPLELDRAARSADAIAWVSASEVGDDALRSFRSMREVLRSLPEEVLVAVSMDELAGPEQEPLRRRWRRFLRRWAHRLRRERRFRRVPLQAIVRTAVEHRLASWAQQEVGSFARLRAGLVDVVRACARARCDLEQAESGISGGTERFFERVRTDFSLLLEAGLLESMVAIRRADLPEADPEASRMSKHYMQISESLQHVEHDPGHWERLLASGVAGLALDFQLQRAHGAVDEALAELVSKPAQGAFSLCTNTFLSVERSLEELANPETQAPASLSSFRTVLSTEHLERLEDETLRLRSASALQRLGLQLRGMLSAFPEKLETVRSAVSTVDLADPRAVRFRTVAPRSVAMEKLVENLLPTIEERLHRASDATAVALEALREVEVIVVHAIEQGERAVFQRALASCVSAREAFEASTRSLTAELLHDTEQAFHDASARLAVHVTAAASEERTGLTEELLSHLQGAVRRGLGHVSARLSALAGQVASLSNADITRRLQGQLARKALDGGTMAQLVAQFRQPSHVPSSYAKLFSAQPVREPRMFRANHEQLAAVVGAERERAGDDTRLSVLVLGPHGSGRTSLLNVAQLELSAPRVLRPQPMDLRKRRGLLHTLAVELGCEVSLREVSKALLRVQTTVLIDDLESWFRPDAAGAADFVTFLDLVHASQSRASFIVTMSNSAYEAYGLVAPLESTFGRIVRLGSLSAAELRQLVESRHTLSGLPLEFHSELGLHWLRRIGSDREASLFYRLLHRRSNGNLALALRMFVASVETAAGPVRVRTERPLSLGLPFIGDLPATQLAALHQSLRFGRVDPLILSGDPQRQSEVRAHLSLLQLTGLLKWEDARSGGRLSTPADLRAIVEHTLSSRSGA